MCFSTTAFQFTAGLYLSFINLGVFLLYSVICALHFTELDVYFLFLLFFLGFVWQCCRRSHFLLFASLLYLYFTLAIRAVHYLITV